jgi:alpha 1,2-mannosyltransferase
MWNNAMGFLSDNDGTDYNLCHCAFLFFPERTITNSRHGFDRHHCDAGHGYEIVWSNFEIADLDFWRGEAYTAFFEYLDSHGGFYYEVL